MTKHLTFLGIAALLLAGRDPLWAHHATARYDKDHLVTMTGLVTEYRFSNPHIEILFEVKDESGSATVWIAQGAAPQEMLRTGEWKRDTLKPGGQITIHGWLSKDGSKTMHIVSMVAPGVKEWHQGPKSYP